MAANTVPIFVQSPQNNWGSSLITTANTAKDGTGTVLTIFTADATNGSFCNRIVVRATGTATASVLRVFMNNGSTNATPANNILIGEVALPATTLSEVNALLPVEVPINLGMEAGYKLNVTLGTTVAAGYAVSAHGGKY